MTQHGTGIEWTHIPGYTGESWNPIVGCSVISPGCTNCYAMRFAGQRLDGNPNTPQYRGTTEPSKVGPVWTGKVNIAREAKLDEPLRWTKPRAVFVNSMGDLFHEHVPRSWIDRVFAVMALCPQHIFIILTKRAARMADYLRHHRERVWREADLLACERGLAENHPSSSYLMAGKANAPECLPHIWLGVSVEDQIRANQRIPALLSTPAAIRFVSAEPLLGPVDISGMDLSVMLGRERRALEPHHHFNALAGETDIDPVHGAEPGWPGLDWVIAGGESGKGARPMHPEWVRSLRDQCQKTATPFFFKQWGDWSPEPPDGATGEERRCAFPDQVGLKYFRRIGKKKAGCLLDGVTHHNWPAIGGAS